jgi:hypothetical protein
MRLIRRSFICLLLCLFNDFHNNGGWLNHDSVVDYGIAQPPSPDQEALTFPLAGGI